jgi:hypothetical protein
MGTLKKVKGVHPLMDKGSGYYGIYVWGKFSNKYFTQFIPGKQEGYATTTKSLPKKIGLGLSKTLHYPSCSTSLGTKNKGNKA